MNVVDRAGRNAAPDPDGDDAVQPAICLRTGLEEGSGAEIIERRIDRLAAVQLVHHVRGAVAHAPIGHVDELVVMGRSEENTSELQSLMRISYAGFGLKKRKYNSKTQD